MPAQAVGRSKLLQELLRHAQEPEALMVPIGSIAVKEWTEYVQRSQEGAFKASEDAQKMDIDAMQRLLLAADVLIDEATKAEVCSSLAATITAAAPPLEPPHAAAAATSDNPDVTAHDIATHPQHTQIFTALSQDLSAAVLQLIPLSCCLTLLPLHLHAPALAAHARTIHAFSTLTLPPLPTLRFPAAASAVAAFPALRSLSFSGHTLWPHAAALTRALRAVPALTALYLADCGLRNTASGDALAAALPRLLHLRTLDVSNNLLTHTTSGALSSVAAGLCQTTSLTALHLAATLTYGAPDHVHALAAAVPHLPALAVVAVGSLATQDQFSWGARFTHALTVLLSTLRRAPALTSLDFHFSNGMSIADTRDTAALWETLGRITQLRRLSLAVPVVKLSSTEKGVWERALGRGLASLGRLTELEVSLHEVVQKAGQPSYAGLVIAPLAALTALRRLRLPQFALADGAATEPLRRVLGLPQLTSVYVWGSRGVTSAQHAAAAAAVESEIAAAVCAAPQIREACLPLHMCAGDHTSAIQDLLAVQDRAGHDNLPAQTPARPPHSSGLSLQMSFSSRGEQMYAEHAQRELLTQYVPLLPAACSLNLMAVGALWLRPLTLNLATLRGVTSLRLSVLHDNDVANASDLTVFLSQLGTLNALRVLSLLLHCGTPDAPAARRAGLSAFCEQLPTLTALTALSMTVDGAGFSAIAAACAAHGRLAALELTARTPHCGSFPIWSITALTTLRSLGVSADDITGADDFWEGLPRLEGLRSLRLHGALTSERVGDLIEAVREGLPALRELHVLRVNSLQSACFAMADLPCLLVCSH